MFPVRIDPDDARAWLAAAQRPEVTDALAALHALAADAIEARGPVCWASGRCCNFERTGHLLFVTGLETAWCLSRLDPALRPTDVAIDAALARGNCPFQSGNLCGVHPLRPLGCRVYFCDRTAQTWQHDLSERLQNQVRDLHARLALPYVYAEWRGLLRGVAAAL